MTTPILEEAHAIIYGEREKTYGDPGKNLRVIADFWNTYLHSLGMGPLKLEYEDVCNMMALMKLARLSTTPLHRDSMVDICGYMALADRVDTGDRNAQIKQGQAGVYGGISKAPGERREACGPQPGPSACNSGRQREGG